MQQRRMRTAIVLGAIAILASCAASPAGWKEPVIGQQREADGASVTADLQAAEAYSLQFSTYLGGSDWEFARDVFVDSAGNAYVTGGTHSIDFPTTPGAYDRTFDDTCGACGSDGPLDAFVAKFDASGNLLWSTLLGGPNYDRAYGVEVDDQGYVYLAGRAGPGFPTTPGVFQPDFQGWDQGRYGWQNAFVAVLSPDGSDLEWASYVGVDSLCRDIAIDVDGDIYLPLGYTGTGPTPPTEWFSNAFQDTPQGMRDAGVIKVTQDGSAVVWATWLGGSADDGSVASIRVDANKNVYYITSTSSNDIPTTPDAWDRIYNGGKDYYVSKLTPDGSDLVYGTYLGGSDAEDISTHNLAIDSQGNAIVSVWTNSSDFPTTPGAFQTAYGGGPSDMAVAKISPTGGLLASTYLSGSGSGDENPDGIYADSLGNIFVTGATSSPDFPVTAGAYQPSNGGVSDAVLVRLSADLSQLLYSTFIGGPTYDNGRSGALGTDGSLFVTGSSNGSWPTLNAFQDTFGGGYWDWGSGDAILAKFAPSGTPVPPTDLDISGPTQGLVGADYAFIATVQPSNATLPITYAWQATSQPAVTNTSGLTDMVSFTWYVTRTKTITVTATNTEGAVTGTHRITIVHPSHRLYLPLILRAFS